DGEESSATPADPSRQCFSAPPSTAPAMAPPSTPAEGELTRPAWSPGSRNPDVRTQPMTSDARYPSSQPRDASDTAADRPVGAWGPDGTAKYLLGPEVVAGSAIESSSVASDVTPTGQATGYYVVNMSFSEQGSQGFADLTTALYDGEGATDAFGI